MIHDLTPKIIEYLQGFNDVVLLIGDRIISPAFSPSEDEDENNPKVTLKQAGGGIDFYKYFFLVRGDTLEEARNVARLIIEKMTQNAIALSGVNVSWTKIDGSMNDSIDEKTKKPEVFFYINIYFLEA